MGLLLLATLLSAAPHAEAQALAKRSIIEYNAGDFEKALADAQRAYELDPVAGLLYNLGQCHRALHHWERAEFFYRGYLREKPKAKNRAEVTTLIAEMRRKEALEEARATAPPSPAIVVPAPPAAPMATQAPPPPAAPTPSGPTVRVAPAAPAAALSAPAPERHVPGIAWGMIGSGAAAGIAGGILWALAGSLRGPAHPTFAAMGQSNDYAIGGNVLVPVGAALILGGAGLAIFGSGGN